MKRTSPVTAVAAAIVGLEGLGIIVLVVIQLLALGAGDADSLVSGIALIVLTAIAAAAVIAFAVAIRRGLSWGRSGGVVTQAMLIAVAIGAATGAYAHPLVGLAIGVPAIITGVLLFYAARAAHPRRDDAG